MVFSPRVNANRTKKSRKDDYIRIMNKIASLIGNIARLTGLKEKASDGSKPETFW